jgi:hypothetical protein
MMAASTPKRANTSRDARARKEGQEQQYEEGHDTIKLQHARLVEAITAAVAPSTEPTMTTNDVADNGTNQESCLPTRATTNATSAEDESSVVGESSIDKIQRELLECEQEMLRLQERRWRLLQSLHYEQQQQQQQQKVAPVTQDSHASGNSELQSSSSRENVLLEGETLNRTCGVCGEQFQSARARSQHCLSEHSMYSCNYCLAAFDSREVLNNHRDNSNHW